MIGDPPLLTIRKSFPRPDPAKLARLSGVPTSFVCDAMNGHGALDPGIKPITSNHAFVGPAMPCRPGPGDNLAANAAMALAEPGDVIVAAMDGWRGSAVAGDLMMGRAKNRRLAGFVTDGLVRDRPDLEAIGLPVQAAGISPNSPFANGPGTVGLAVTIAGVTVSPGDVIVADIDGVVVIPLAALDATLDALEQVKANEARVLEAVRAGLEVTDAMRRLLASDRVKWVD